MSTLAVKLDPYAVDVAFVNDAVPLEWFPRLCDANDKQPRS